MVVSRSPSLSHGVEDSSLNSTAELYKAIYSYVMDQERIGELTVEDPAEAFEDLRDRNDLRMLLGIDAFMSEALGGGVSTKSIDLKAKGKLGPPYEKGWVEKWRRELKMAGVRGFYFCLLLY